MDYDLENLDSQIAELQQEMIEKITVYDNRCDVEFKSGIITEVYV